MAYLVHHGIKGQKWGVRRFQNEDGSLTTAGMARYNDGNGRLNRRERKIQRLDKKQKEWSEYSKYDYREDGFTKEESDSIRAASKKKADRYAEKLKNARAVNKSKRPSKAKEFAKDFVEGNAEVAIDNAKRFAKGVAGLAAARLGTYAVSKGTQFYWTMSAATHGPMYQTVDNIFGSRRKNNPPNVFNAKRSEYTIR